MRKWMNGAPARRLRARLYNRRVQRMKVVQGGAAGWSEFRVMVWAMTVSMDGVMRSSVRKRMMFGVRVTIEGKPEKKVKQQRAREQQFDWEYYCWLVQVREQEREQCRQTKEREKQYREAQGIVTIF